MKYGLPGILRILLAKSHSNSEDLLSAPRHYCVEDALADGVGVVVGAGGKEAGVLPVDEDDDGQVIRGDDGDAGAG